MLKIFKILFIYIILLYSFGNAEEYKKNNSKKVISATLNINYGDISYKINKKGNSSDKAIYSNLQVNYDYYYNRLHFQMTPYMYFYDTQDGKKLRNGNKNLPYKKEDIFFRSFYISYLITNTTSIGVGILPFSNSNFLDYENNFINDGEGLSMLNDSNLMSIFFRTKINNTKIVGGVGMLNSFMPMGSYQLESMRKGTTTLFLTSDTYFNKNNNLRMINEILYSNIKYNNKYNISKLYLLGTGLSYDDSLNTGLVYYGTFGISIYKNNNIDAKESILKTNKIPNYIYKNYPGQFDFNNKTYIGAAYLLGIRKDFDIFKHDFYINLKWFHTYNDWTSANIGSPYNVSFNSTYNVRNNAYFAQIGLNINSKSSIGFSLEKIEVKKISKVGATMDTIPYKDSIFPLPHEVNILKIKYIYRF